MSQGECLKAFSDDIRNVRKVESLQFGVIKSLVLEVDGVKIDVNV